MSACRRGGPIFILKTAFKNINKAQQNVNRVFRYNVAKFIKKRSKHGSKRLNTAK